MVAYIKHISMIMRRAGAENTYENKVILDGIIREVLKMQGADSNEVWEKVKGIMFAGDPARKKLFEDTVVRIFIKKLVTG